MSADSTKKTLIVALGVCLVCSILVSTAAVSLNRIQKENKKIDRFKNILEAAGIEAKDSVEETYQERIESQVVTLESGETIDSTSYPEELDPVRFDIDALVDNPEWSLAIPPKQDVAQIKRMPSHMAVYELREDDKIQKLILPVYGKGLWSTMYGFLTLGPDLKTIKGITFYEHGETPGLGGEIDNPKWKQQWDGKKAFGPEGDVRIQVIKGTVDATDPNSQYKVDGLSGATITSRGVDNMVQFWLGENGYGPFLAELKEEGTRE
jgi:Na+-transporting NADH:ubiquinone oxidoreductase subunit C